MWAQAKELILFRHRAALFLTALFYNNHAGPARSVCSCRSPNPVSATVRCWKARTKALCTGSSTSEEHVLVPADDICFGVHSLPRFLTYFLSLHGYFSERYFFAFYLLHNLSGGVIGVKVCVFFCGRTQWSYLKKTSRAQSVAVCLMTLEFCLAHTTFAKNA